MAPAWAQLIGLVACFTGSVILLVAYRALPAGEQQVHAINGRSFVMMTISVGWWVAGLVLFALGFILQAGALLVQIASVVR
jgi:hypothetical protein